MIAELLVLVAMPVLLLAAGLYDLASFTIPNFLSAALAALFLAFAAAAGFSPALLGWHLGAGVMGLVLGFGLFAFGWIGGGDAKLAASTALWLGFAPLMEYLLVASIFGGVLTLFIMRFRLMPLPAMLQDREWAMRLHRVDAGVPYGIALAAAALTVYPHTIWMKLPGL